MLYGLRIMPSCATVEAVADAAAISSVAASTCSRAVKHHEQLRTEVMALPSADRLLYQISWIATGSQYSVGS